MFMLRREEGGGRTLTWSLLAREDVDPQLTCLTAVEVRAQCEPRAPLDLVDLDSSLTSSVMGAEPSRCRSIWRESVGRSE